MFFKAFSKLEPDCEVTSLGGGDREEGPRKLKRTLKTGADFYTLEAHVCDEKRGRGGARGLMKGIAPNKSS